MIFVTSDLDTMICLTNRRYHSDENLGTIRNLLDQTILYADLFRGGCGFGVIVILLIIIIIILITLHETLPLLFAAAFEK